MSANKLREVKIPVFDFYKDKPLLIMIGGYRESRSILYIMYIILLYSSLAYFVAFGAYAALMVVPRKALIMDDIHALSICLFSAGGLTSKVLTSRSLKETSNMINMGIYNCNEEDTDEEEMKMKTAIPDEIRRKTNIFVFIFAGGVAVEMIVFPISQLILLEHDDPARFDPIVNAFLPPVFFFYKQFNTQTVIGNLTAYILTIIHIYVNFVLQSTRLFERLCDLPWFHYSKSFNRTLAIMMGYSLKPISIRIFLLDGGACLETYGDVVSAAYKVMSLVRHSDSMKE